MPDNANPVPQPNLERQKSLNLSLPRAVAVIGCGGVGSWTALFLALAGVPKLYLFDHDTVSDSNLNRLPVSPDTINVNKAAAIANRINELRPNCDILALNQFTPELATSMNLRSNIDWLCATTDTLCSRQSAYKWCTQTSTKSADGKSVALAPVKYIEAAAEGEWGSATGSPAEWASELETKPGYESVPVHCVPCVIAAGMAVNHMIHNTSMPYVARIGFDGSRISTIFAND